MDQDPVVSGAVQQTQGEKRCFLPQTASSLQSSPASEVHLGKVHEHTHAHACRHTHTLVHTHTCAHTHAWPFRHPVSLCGKWSERSDSPTLGQTPPPHFVHTVFVGCSSLLEELLLSSFPMEPGERSNTTVTKVKHSRPCLCLELIHVLGSLV